MPTALKGVKNEKIFVTKLKEEIFYNVQEYFCCKFE